MENKQLVSQLLKKFGDKVRELQLSPEQAAVLVDSSILIVVDFVALIDIIYIVDFLSI